MHCKYLLPHSVLSWLYWFTFEEPVIFDAILDIKDRVYFCKILFILQNIIHPGFPNLFEQYLTNYHLIIISDVSLYPDYLGISIFNYVLFTLTFFLKKKGYRLL